MSGENAYIRELHKLWAANWPESVPPQPVYPFGETPLTDYLRAWSRRQPDKPAYVFYGAELTYRQLEEQSNRFAALLAQHGVQRRDRVAVFLPNCPQFVIAFFGILKLGCVHVPVNPMFQEHELLYELNDSGAVAILAQDQLLNLVRSVQPRTKLRLVLFTSYADALPSEPSIPVPGSIRQAKLTGGDAIDLIPALESAPREYPAPEVSLDDVAALNYTGGTTGMPKGCVHTQRDMIYTAATTCTIGLMKPRDVSLCFHPVFWIAGEDIALIFNIFSGTTCVLLARWDPAAWLAAIQRHRVTIAGMLVDNAVEVMDHPDAAKCDFSSLRRVTVSSFVKKLNVEYRRRWQALTGTTLIESAWGMTETHTCDTFTAGMQNDDMDLNSQPVFVGLPMPGTEFKICSFETGEIQPLGREGEICVRSPSILKGYWNKPEETVQALKNGWLHTGDIGVIDQRGYLHFLGRRKEMLKVNGMSVFPAEIEGLLGQHPAVTGSGVIGRQDSARGETPVAFVRIAPDQRSTITEAEIQTWCRKNMAIYKVPEIHFVDELPLTTTGKVKKGDLARLLGQA
ncbi:MAG: AMP-binding protein [Acidobacteriia bacterium]|nr:AMP-binding protein [Terriglobia bacterium]